eukprot:CAMPEP_0198109446 /NCGR_PEP_ID=MMETSP1442-20131203/1476_1 /TAXON_ID= /ORGANISM="Craspedostauros australis, Strain CCMP3328" /LENGTH=467 /DNA_ID=CAMNT_0043765111 /DNA_START=88 /DNA_END=1492 /DNA_ORIENTATION=+
MAIHRRHPCTRCDEPAVVGEQHDHDHPGQSGSQQDLPQDPAVRVAKQRYLLPPQDSPAVHAAGRSGGRSAAAMGNDMTCSLSGFIYTTSATATACYTAFISINFLLQIKYKWTEEMVVKRIEPFYHSVTIIYIVGVSGFAWVMESYNPLSLVGICYISEYPDGCINEDDVECERGGAISAAIGRMGSVSVLIIAIVGFVCTYMLHRTVRQTLSRGMRHSMTTSAMVQQQQERKRIVTRQCVLYCLVYANSMFWNILTQILISAFHVEDYLGNPAVFVYLFLASICISLNGVLNLIIFVSPRYQQWRNALPNEPATYILRCALSDQELPKRESRIHQYSGSTRTGCKLPPNGKIPPHTMSSIATTSTRHGDSDEQRFSHYEHSDRLYRGSIGLGTPAMQHENNFNDDTEMLDIADVEPDIRRDDNNGGDDDEDDRCNDAEASAKVTDALERRQTATPSDEESETATLS